MSPGVLWIAAAAVMGGILAALLGFIESAEPFDARKFIKSCITALFSGVVFGLGYGLTNEPRPIDYLLAFTTGAGLDVLANRGLGTIRALVKPPG